MINFISLFIFKLQIKLLHDTYLFFWKMYLSGKKSNLL